MFEFLTFFVWGRGAIEEILHSTKREKTELVEKGGSMMTTKMSGCAPQVESLVVSHKIFIVIVMAIIRKTTKKNKSPGLFLRIWLDPFSTIEDVLFVDVHL